MRASRATPRADSVVALKPLASPARFRAIDGLPGRPVNAVVALRDVQQNRGPRQAAVDASSRHRVAAGVPVGATRAASAEGPGMIKPWLQGPPP